MINFKKYLTKKKNIPKYLWLLGMFPLLMVVFIFPEAKIQEEDNYEKKTLPVLSSIEEQKTSYEDDDLVASNFITKKASIVSTQKNKEINKNTNVIVARKIHNKSNLNQVIQASPKIKRDYSTTYVAPKQNSAVIRIKATTMIKARVIQPISSEQLSHTVIALVDNTDDYPWLNNAKVIGDAQVTSKERIFVHFSKLILENGQEISISAHALSPQDHLAGIIGHVDERVKEDIVKVLSENAVDIVAGVVQTVTNGYGRNIARAATAKKIQNINTDEVITVKANTTILLFFDESIMI